MTPHVATKPGSMFEPRLDSVTFERKVRTTRYGHPDDDDLSKEPNYSYIVEKHDDKKQEEEVNFKSTVEFKFKCEDNLKEDIQVQRRGPDVRSLEDGNMHGGTEDSYAAVQQPCTTRKFPISFSKNTKQIKMPSTEAQRLLRQQFSPPTHSCEDLIKKNFCTAPMGDEH